MSLPVCSPLLPEDMSSMVSELGRRWARSDLCPSVEPEVERAWSRLLDAWVSDPELPLLVRKNSLVRGSEVLHTTGRKIVPCDNAPAQWACNLAVRGVVPTVAEIKAGFGNNAIPVSFAHKANEKELRKYHCTLGQFSVNKAGWKLCHINPVGLNSRTPIGDIEIDELHRAFINLLSPGNYFLLPIQWGGLGETREFIDGYVSNKTPNKPLEPTLTVAARPMDAQR